MSNNTANELTTGGTADTYRQFRERVTEVERGLVEKLPISDTADISEALELPAQAIETERRTSRAVPVLNVYQHLTAESPPDSLVSALTALDVIINAADDLVDVRPLENRDRVTHTSNVLFGHLQLFSSLDTPEAAIPILTEYYTAVAQIPRVERQLQRRLIDASDHDDVVATARAIYEYDSVDIEGFVLLPTTHFDFSPETTATLLDDFRTFRARHLLYEDLRHIERTAAQGDTNPVMYLIEEYDSAAVIAETLRDVLLPLEYPDDGDHVPLLQSFEREPEDLDAMVERQLATR